ncbi:MAG: rhodanese-like domain-containing protein [Bacteroidetes bacterium]|nr:rhodanese-like domain-containing protein [Bacteroidota bacterium]
MEITVQELKAKFQQGEKFLFIDVREPWEYEAFNIGAKLMPLNDLVAHIWELEEHKNEEIVLHCRSGARSGMAQSILQANGFTNVLNLKGGILAWEDAFGKTQP